MLQNLIELVFFRIVDVLRNALAMVRLLLIWSYRELNKIMCFCELHDVGTNR